MMREVGRWVDGQGNRVIVRLDLEGGQPRLAITCRGAAGSWCLALDRSAIGPMREAIDVLERTEAGP